jgi:Type IV secretion-system coupling protein DNA-binding domain
MYEANETSTREIDPLAPVEQLVEWFMGTTVHVVLGVVVGLIAARAMRRGHLHWSWAAGACALVFLGRTLFAGTALTLCTATLLAAVRGRRWHREDLLAGADLAEIAAERTTPLDGLRAGVRFVRDRFTGSGTVARAKETCVRRVACLSALWRRRREDGDDASGAVASTGPRPAPRGGGRSERWFRGDELIVGTDRRGKAASIELGGSTGGTHALVVGAAGSGKTVTQTWIAARAIENGMAVVVVDPKNDRWMHGQLRRAADAAGKRFILWSPSGPEVYNPYARGSETEIADKALAGERFTEPHYQRQAQRYLGHAVRALRAAGSEASLAALVEALDPAGLESIARDCPEGQARAVYAYLDSLTPRQRSDLTGVRDRLAIMAESDIGPWLDPAGADAEPFDLLETIRTGAVVCFSLRADSRPLVAKMLAGAIVQDLQTAVSALQERPARCLVVIDEFSAVAAEQVARLFARARSAGVSLLLGTQELSDMRIPGRESLLDQVLGNLTSVIVHRQVVPASAELIARLSGSRGAWRTTLSSTGRDTRTRVSEQIIGPEEVMGLPRGCAAVIRLAGRRGAVIASMHSPGQV